MRLVLLAAALAIAAPARAVADDDGDPNRSADKGTLGIGVILGEPTGVSAKLYVKDDQAIQGAVGSAFGSGGLQLHADYVFHPYILQTRQSYVLPVYIGPGIRLIDYTNGRDDSSFAFGVRGVAGMLFDFKDVPLDVFVEIAGVLEYEFKDGEGAAIRFNGGAGARYYF